MSLTNTQPLAAAALLVLEKEMLWNDAQVTRGQTYNQDGSVSSAPNPAVIAAKKADLDAAQASYENEVDLRTPGAVGAISPATVTEHITARDTVVVGP